jgi:hypothetical protein
VSRTYDIAGDLQRRGDTWLDAMQEVLACERDGDTWIVVRQGARLGVACGHCRVWAPVPVHVAAFPHDGRCQVLRARATVELARRQVRVGA